MTLTLVAPLVAPLGRTTPAALASLPGTVSIAGRTFFLELGPDSVFRRASAPQNKQQIDQSPEPGEQSLGDGWWRRSQSDFSGGAGQLWYDREQSVRSMFRSSKGVDPFTQAPEVICQRDVDTARSSANTNLFTLRAEHSGTEYTFFVDGQSLLRTTDPFADPVAFTTITGLPAATIDSLANSGQDLYVGYSGNGIKKVALSGTSGAGWSAQNATLVRWIKQRIMAANANVIYELDSSGTATARYTHWNSSWTWTDFTEIGPAILVAGHVGGRSMIFRSKINTDGTLAVFVSAVEGGLPEGEVVRTLHSYLQFVFIGTNKGIRVATHDSEGNLTYGPLVPIDTTCDVRAITAQGEFVWFGWTNYDADSTGLGRLDLRTFVVTLRPAYASDLMADGQGNVLAISTHNGRRVFAVSGLGFFGEATTYVAEATLQLSRFGYGASLEKIAKHLEVNAVASSGSITPAVAGFDDAFSDLSPVTADGLRTLSVSSERSSALSIKCTFAPVAGGASTPTLKDLTLLSLPAKVKQRVIVMPLRLYDYVHHGRTRVGHQGKAQDDLDFLEFLDDQSDTVAVEDLTGVRFDARIENIDFRTNALADQRGIGGGVCVVTLSKV